MGAATLCKQMGSFELYIDIHLEVSLQGSTLRVHPVALPSNGA